MPGLPTISSQTLITATLYNDIRNEIKSLVETAYGSTLVYSTPISQGLNITAEYWDNLILDFQRLSVHQLGSPTTIQDEPLVGEVITRVFGQDLIDNVNTAYTNSTTVAANQLALVTTQSSTSSFITGVSQTSMTAVLSYNPSSVALKQYFNLGGKVNYRIGSVLPSSPSIIQTRFHELLVAANAVTSASPYDWDQYQNQNNTLYLTSAGTWTSVLSNVIVNGTGTVRLTAIKNVSLPGTVSISYNLELLKPIGVNVLLTITGTATSFYSISTPVEGIPGIAGAPPSFYRSREWSNVLPPPEPTPRVILTPSVSNLFYTFSATTVSASQSIGITNNGNTTATISSIEYQNASSIKQVATYTIGGYGSVTSSTTVAPGITRSFSLAYTGTSVGVFGSSVILKSNDSRGDVIIATQQTVTTAPTQPFTFTLTPSSITLPTSITTPITVGRKFVIVPENGTFTSYTAGTSNGDFTVNSSTPEGPYVEINFVGKPAGTYSTIISVTVNGVTKTASVVIPYAPATTVNLGSWLSPRQKYNALVGASYDIIGGQRYLTLGFGMGADGSNDVFTTGGTSGIYTTTSLTTNSDSKFTVGPVLYKVTTTTSFNSFLSSHGVWIRNTDGPKSVEVARNYNFTVDTTGNHSFKFSGAHQGAKFYIDSNLRSLVDTTVTPWLSTYTGTVYLSAGAHTIGFGYTQPNIQSSYITPAVAFNLIDSANNEIFNSLYPVRSSTPYQYWNEVYRIPIAANGTTATYQSKSYIIKNSNGAEFNNLGNYFGAINYDNDGSMFKVTDEQGLGTLLVEINPVLKGTTSLSTENQLTIEDAKFLPYYYSARTLSRWTASANLDSGPTGDGTQTRFFIGFTKDGAVRTRLIGAPNVNGSTTNVDINSTDTFNDSRQER